MFVRDYTIKLLGTSFPNMTVTQVRLQPHFLGCAMSHHKPNEIHWTGDQVVDGLLSSKHDLPSFKNHIRDFLVQSKEFSAQVTSSVSLAITFILIICI